MRLTGRQKDIIHLTAKKYFGNEVAVFLFGSRLDDAQRGGDIDLLLDRIIEERKTTTYKIAFIIELKKLLGDQKIDVVFKSDNAEKSGFQKIIEENMIRIC